MPNINFRRRLMGSNAFNPASLFAGGRQGVFYDFSRWDTLFQTDNTSQPVTALSQVCGRANDLSGNGNHVSQATATNRPLVDEGGGRRFLTFDGVNDYLELGALTANWTGRVEIYAAMRITGGGYGYACDVVSGGRLAAAAPVGASAELFRSAAATYSPSPAVANNTDYVFGFISDGAASSFLINSQVSGAVDSGTSTVSSLRVGTRQDILFRHAGRYYALVIVNGTLTAAERQNLMQWLAAKSGAAL